MYLNDFQENILWSLLQSFQNNLWQKLWIPSRTNVPAIGVVRITFACLTLKMLQTVYKVTMKYQKLFEHFCGLFAEMLIKLLPNDLETRIARRIMHCEKTPKTHKMYRPIVQSLVVNASLPRHKADIFTDSRHWRWPRSLYGIFQRCQGQATDCRPDTRQNNSELHLLSKPRPTNSLP